MSRILLLFGKILHQIHSLLKATYTECRVGTCQGKANKKIKVTEFSTKSWTAFIDMFKTTRFCPFQGVLTTRKHDWKFLQGWRILWRHGLYLGKTFNICSSNLITLAVTILEKRPCSLVHFFRLHWKTAAHQLSDITRGILNQIVQFHARITCLRLDQIFKGSYEVWVLRGVTGENRNFRLRKSQRQSLLLLLF